MTDPYSKMSPDQIRERGEHFLELGQRLLKRAHEAQMQRLEERLLHLQAKAGDFKMGPTAVAAMTKYSVRYIQELKADGKMPFDEDGKIWRSQVIRWIAQNRPKKAKQLGFSLKTAS